MQNKDYVIFVVDASESMSSLTETTLKVFNSQFENIVASAKVANSETRISLYSFNHDCRRVFFDSSPSAMRFNALNYLPRGNTNIEDAVTTVISDHQKIEAIHPDSSFLVILLSDGQQNCAVKTSLKNKALELGENWTLMALAPDMVAVHWLKQVGFPAGNIKTWDVGTKKGMEEAGISMQAATSSYYTVRSTGAKGAKNLFSLNPINKADVEKMEPLAANEYVLLRVSGKKGEKIVISDFVKSWKIDYIVGSAYYQLTKPEKVQVNKQVCVRDKRNGRVYSGSNARKILGLPNHEVKVAPVDYDRYDLFFQSSSTNRHLVDGTDLLILK